MSESIIIKNHSIKSQMFKFLIFMIQNTNCEINNKYFLIFLIFFKNILLYEDTIS